MALIGTPVLYPFSRFLSILYNVLTSFLNHSQEVLFLTMILSSSCVEIKSLVLAYPTIFEKLHGLEKSINSFVLFLFDITNLIS